MIKALAVEIDGCQAVKGATKEYLADHGAYLFTFRSAEKAGHFQVVVDEFFHERVGEIDYV